MYARIEKNKVVELVAFNPAGMFHKSLVFVKCEDTVKVNDGFDGKNFSSYIKEKLTPKEKANALKFAGIKFEGVLCSAEAQDMWGLSSIKEFIAAGNSTPFVFENGNTLLLTPDNLAEFQAVWIPFRLGFFK